MSAYLKSAVATSLPLHPAGKRSSAAAAAQASSNRLTHVDASSASWPSSTLRRSASPWAKRVLMGLGCVAARAAMLRRSDASTCARVEGVSGRVSRATARVVVEGLAAALVAAGE